ncbi:MAG: SDR family NAD(P)-dependent oxidoreductase, partial [Acidimicrobiales bacterium]
MTGAAGGLGSAIARRFATEGDRVCVLDIDGGAARQMADRLPGDAVGLGASVAVPDEVEAALDHFGTPDVVVNNAGIVRFGPLAELELDDWRAVVDVNLTGTFVVARAVARRWLATGRPGVMVNVTSMNGVAPGPNAGA